MSPNLVQRADAQAGACLERMIRAHHLRRLVRIGRRAQLDPPDDGVLWSRGAPAPRPGCALEVLVDGEEALSEIASSLAGARSHVHISGWHMSPEFELTRGPRAAPIRELLRDLAERVEVRVLLWAGAPARLFTPDRSDMRNVHDELTRGTKVDCALDDNERPMHCHHEKLVIVDDETAFVGGIDLTALAGDRFDTPEHPVRAGTGWHDAAARLCGPAVADVAAHFASRWRAVTGESLAAAPVPARAGDVAVQVVRSVPERVYDFQPAGDFRILESYVRALRSARSLVYLESQFLWSSQLVRILAGKLREPPSDGFRVIVLLPAKPNNGADMTRGQLGVLAEADRDGERFIAATITARSGPTTGPLYVHAKIGIVDDSWLTIGSANLNDHSLFNDTEVNVVTCDRELARSVRLRLWSEHLERPVEDVAGEPSKVIDELWRPIAAEQLERRRRGEPASHRLLELPRVSRRSTALLGPLQGLLVDG